MADCQHCGAPVPEDSSGGAAFCCRGCAAAYDLVRGLGLDAYYQRRCLDPEVRPLTPDAEEEATDFSLHVAPAADAPDESELHLMVEGLHCAACVWLIESVLSRQEGVTRARVNMTTRRLAVRWQGPPHRATEVLTPVLRLGYRLVPYDPERLADEGRERERELLRCMAVAGFAAANVMLFSVSIWAGHGDMLPVTRDLFHWISALIALPALLYAGRPFYRSALTALRAGRTNMDVPISLAVLLAAGLSLWETMRGGPHAYFESAVMLLFFLLVGRFLDARARGRARATAEYLVSLGARAVTVEDADGHRRQVPPRQVTAGMTAITTAGERVAVDGIVRHGRSDVDNSLVTGESVPAPVGPGDRVFAGTLNLSGPLTITVAAVGEGTLLGEIVRMMEAAEQGRARHVALADRVARWYAPFVHGLALLTFLGWTLGGGLAWQPALLIAVSVLIITCPCALALAVPAVQVIASGRLMRQGILLKSATALERLAGVDHVVFDKTGTLTRGRLKLAGGWADTDPVLRRAAGLARGSRHPLARALAEACPGAPAPTEVTEVPGAGLVAVTEEGEWRLGRHRHVDPEGQGDGAPAVGPELWFAGPQQTPVRFSFTDTLRADAAAVVHQLQARGIQVSLLSGDRAPTVAAMAAEAGIQDWQAEADPAAKVARLQHLTDQGARVAMVGDGLNDAPALAAATVSLSPATAADISQTAADVVFQGDRLAPVTEALTVARRAEILVRQNMTLSLVYNGLTIPLAVAGYVTPLVAAVAMSASSLVVIGNALRLGRRTAPEKNGRRTAPEKNGRRTAPEKNGNARP